jgi:hypothetical protein
MTYDEIAIGIACKRWPASTRIKTDVEILRMGLGRVSTRERRLFGALGFFTLGLAEFTNSLAVLWIGMTFVTLAVTSVLNERRRNRVLVWFHAVQNV